MEFKNRSQAMKQTKLSYIGGVNTSAKIVKNAKINMKTYVLYLAPAKQSGYNTCINSTPECRMGCLNTSGRAGMEVVSGSKKTSNCRNVKTRLLFENTDFFMNWVVAEMTAEKAKAESNGFVFSARLNGTSDIDWANIRLNGKNLFEIFPTTEFYDYTKNHKKFSDIAPNYHLTMSYTGRNWLVCNALLKQGYNVAVVFDVKKGQALPETFNGYKVVDGDIFDYRVSDPKGTIVGLRWKKIGDKTANDTVRNSCFVIKPHEMNVPVKVKQTKELIYS